MQSKLTYEYAIIRLVPKVEREEFLNIGVIVFSKRKNFLAMKYRLDPERIKSLSGETDLALINNYLQAWESVCEGHSQGGSIGQLELPYRFRWLTAARSTILQTSRVHPGICQDPEDVLEEIFKSYVL